MYNRIVARFIFSALDARGLNESKFAKQAGVARSVVSHHLRGVRKIRPNHLAKYMVVLDHQEQPKLLAAWLRDNFPDDVTAHLLNDVRDNLSPEVKDYAPPLDDDHRKMLAWLAREMARDAELADLFTLLSARAGYRPRRTATGPAKRRPRRRN